MEAPVNFETIIVDRVEGSGGWRRVVTAVVGVMSPCDGVILGVSGTAVAGGTSGSSRDFFFFFWEHYIM